MQNLKLLYVKLKSVKSVAKINIFQGEALNKDIVNNADRYHKHLLSLGCDITKEEMLLKASQYIESLSETSKKVTTEINDFVLDLLSLKKSSTPLLTSVWVGEKFQDVRGVNSITTLYAEVVEHNTMLTQQCVINHFLALNCKSQKPLTT